MYVPDARTDEAYNQKYLNNIDKEYVRGYDHAVDDVLDSFFANLDIYDWDVDGEDIDLYKILTNHPDICDKLAENLKEFFESSRDEMIVSLIDHMDDEEYENIKKEVDSK